eukprot:TRINITY_DN94379_c0_g1_i1.p1 TRINITY_DN94379_c0_g1~~TRINITY_DN94379_c0_g1_i1.p1  ORF type:complete len:258 (+),score=51.94 TRINITY_DN94379_c0_g1_i1:29-802(+)
MESKPSPASPVSAESILEALEKGKSSPLSLIANVLDDPRPVLSTPPKVSTLIGKIAPDMVHEVFLFLSIGPDVLAVMCTCRKLYQIAQATPFLTELARRELAKVPAGEKAMFHACGSRAHTIKMKIMMNGVHSLAKQPDGGEEAASSVIMGMLGMMESLVKTPGFKDRQQNSVDSKSARKVSQVTETNNSAGEIMAKKMKMQEDDTSEQAQQGAQQDKQQAEELTAAENLAPTPQPTQEHNCPPETEAEAPDQRPPN